MRAATALSEHPLASHAVGEVAGSIMDEMNGEPIDLLVIFFHGSHIGAIEDIDKALRELLDPKHSIGTAACGVIGANAEVEFRQAISVWAASGLSAEPFRVEAQTPAPQTGWSSHWEHALLFADPFSVPLPGLLDEAERAAPSLVISGGLASAAAGPSGNRLLLDGEIHNNGAVGVALSDVTITPVVSQGCRPVGEPMTVTATAGPTGQGGHVITKLGAKPPLTVLQHLVAKATEDERSLLAQGVQIGVVIDEGLHEHTTGDFLIRGVLGADKESGALAVGTEVPVGTTVQFHVRDAASASEDLLRALAGHEASSTLVFTCSGRGENLFGYGGHDAEMVCESTNSKANAGMFCAGEFGPVSGRNYLHGFTASALLFG